MNKCPDRILAYFVIEVNPQLAKPPFHFNGGLANLRFTCPLKYAKESWFALWFCNQ